MERPRSLVVRLLRLILAMATVQGNSTVFAQQPDNLTRKGTLADAKAQYELGERFLDQGDIEQAEMWLRKSGDAGYVAAEIAMAEMFQQGKGVSRNEQEAYKWYLRAANQGDDRAQTIVGIDYKFGEAGASKDVHQAARWFQMAARHGNTEARTNLSELLAQGLITKDEADWTKQLAASGATPAKKKAFSISEIEIGLRGGMTSTRMATLVKQFGTDFTMTAAVEQRLLDDGADETLLSAILSSRR